ncbi:unnamed protein product, partial [marine sediment metagenome]
MQFPAVIPVTSISLPKEFKTTKSISSEVILKSKQAIPGTRTHFSGKNLSGLNKGRIQA